MTVKVCEVCDNRGTVLTKRYHERVKTWPDEDVWAQELRLCPANCTAAIKTAARREGLGNPPLPVLKEGE